MDFVAIDSHHYGTESSGCETYVESSSLTQDNLKEVFDNAIMEGLRSRQERARKKGKKKKKCTIL